MNLVITDDGILYDVIYDIEKLNLVEMDDDDWEVPFWVADRIEETIAEAAKEALESVNKMFKEGDRVMAYNHKGAREGKGTVIRSRDRRLLNYIHVRLDSGLEAYYRADLCRRLVPKKSNTG